MLFQAVHVHKLRGSTAWTWSNEGICAGSRRRLGFQIERCLFAIQTKTTYPHLSIARAAWGLICFAKSLRRAIAACGARSSNLELIASFGCRPLRSHGRTR